MSTEIEALNKIAKILERMLLNQTGIALNSDEIREHKPDFVQYHEKKLIMAGTHEIKNGKLTKKA